MHPFLSILVEVVVFLAAAAILLIVGTAWWSQIKIARSREWRGLAPWPLVLISIVAVFAIALLFGGRAYILGTRTTSRNKAAAEHLKELREMPPYDVEAVQRERAERKVQSEEEWREKHGRNVSEARRESTGYLESLLDSKGDEDDEDKKK